MAVAQSIRAYSIARKGESSDGDGYSKMLRQTAFSDGLTDEELAVIGVSVQ